MIPEFTSSGRKGELIRPTRFLPWLETLHKSVGYAYGPVEINSGTSEPNLTQGNYQHGWVAYIDLNDRGHIEKKLYNSLWDGIQRELISLVGGIKKLSLDFDRNGYPIVGYVRPNKGLGIWWRNPDNNQPQLVDLETNVQDALISVENKDEPLTTDIFLWYFKDNKLYLRLYSEKFQIAHLMAEPEILNPVLIQAGINHRYGYQVDYRSDPNPQPELEL